MAHTHNLAELVDIPKLTAWLDSDIPALGDRPLDVKLMALPQAVPYGGAALNAMTVSLSREYAPKVRVNTISPAAFLTDIANAWDPEARKHMLVALGRAGNPPEIVTAALMLASPASSYTTGALVRVDGGQR